MKFAWKHLACLLALGLSLIILNDRFFSSIARSKTLITTNLLLNPSFENNQDGWVPSPGTTIFQIVSSPVYSGGLAAAISSQTNSTKAIVQTVSGIVGGDTYSLSGYGYKDDANVAALRLRLAWYETADCSGSQLNTVDSNALTTNAPVYVFLTTGSTIAPQSAQCVQIRAQLQPASENTATAYFDALRFQAEANIPPTATPAAPPSPIVIPVGSIIFSEIAWSGTAASANDEWLELQNVTTQTISLAGWTITSTNGLHIDLSGQIEVGSYYLLERTDDSTISDIVADQLYTGSLSNDGDQLFLNYKSSLIDTANISGGSWPAGTASPSYISMERTNGLQPDADDNWHANNQVDRYGLDADGQPINGSPKHQNSALDVVPTPTSTPTSPPLLPTPTATATPNLPKTGIVINEIAWSGTQASASDEWIELKSTLAQTITLAGWTITSTSGLYIELRGVIPADGYFLLERTDDDTIADIDADQIYTGGLPNSGDQLFLSHRLGVVDSANHNAGPWPGGSVAPDYASLERVEPLFSDADENWSSNNGRERNGFDADGNIINGTPKQPNSTTYPPPPILSLLIREILYDGLIPSTEGDEFVEVCNLASASGDLSGYKIGDEETSGAGEGMYQFPLGLILPAKACLIVAKNAAQFFARFNHWPNFEVVTQGDGYIDTAQIPNLERYTVWGSGSWALTNHSDELLILGPDNQVIDAIAYRDGNYDVLGLLPYGQAKEPYSLQRIWPFDSDWIAVDFYHDHPTPGNVTPLQGGDDVVTESPISPTWSDGMQIYFGSLRSKSTFSGGSAPPAYLFAQAQARGLHFLGLSDSLETLHEVAWQATQTAALSSTIADEFIALPGVTWASETFGQVSLFGINDLPTDNNLSTYLANHPWVVGQIHGSENAALSSLQLYELNEAARYSFSKLKDRWTSGWRVAPTGNVALQAPHWGRQGTGYTGVVAPTLTADALLTALHERRVFATSHLHLALGFQANQHWMGEILSEPGPLSISVYVDNVHGEATTLRFYDRTALLTETTVMPPFVWKMPLITRPGHYYWVSAEQADGDWAITAPLWVEGVPEAETILINEFLPNPGDTDWNGDGTANSEDEWIEIFNPNDFPVSLEGWFLSDESGRHYEFFEGAFISGHTYTTLPRTKTGIAINNDEDLLILRRADESVSDAISHHDDPGKGITVCRRPDSNGWWTRCLPSPNKPNILLSHEAPLELSIYEAKRVTEGAWVKVNGYVTVPPSVFGKNILYLQDETHGIRIQLPSKHGLQFEVGDRLEVVGYLDLSRSEWEIDVKGHSSHVKRLSGQRLIAPLPISTGLLSEGYEGILVQLEGRPVTFERGKRHFWLDDATGPAYIYIYSPTQIKRSGLSLDRPMVVVGIVNQRVDADGDPTRYRLSPRFQFDIMQKQELVVQPTLAPRPVPSDWPTMLPETGLIGSE